MACIRPASHQSQQQDSLLVALSSRSFHAPWEANKPYTIGTRSQLVANRKCSQTSFATCILHDEANSGIPKTKALNLVYRIQGRNITCAVAPHEEGVKFYLHHNKDTAKVANIPNVVTTGLGPHHVQETVSTLIGLGCEESIAWKLLRAVNAKKGPPSKLVRFISSPASALCRRARS
jgi:hypothetical protein